MPHASLQIVDGVNQNRTPALNQAGVSQSQLVRYMSNNRGGILLQKIGGWDRYFPNTMVSIPRALWAWSDTQAVQHLGVGMENIGDTFQTQLAAITDGNFKDITPQSQTNNETLDVKSTNGDSIITIGDATVQDITAFDSVYIPCHISIGGVVLFGLYPCNPDGSTGTVTYTVQAVDVLGQPLPATASSMTGAVAEFATTTGSSEVEVTLPDHGYSVGDTYPILIPTVVGGMTLFNHYDVQTVIDADTFTITGPVEADSNDTASINGGKACYMYLFGVGAIPSGTGFGIGGFGRGGFGTGTGVTPSLGEPIRAIDWTLDNWGEALIACPSSPLVELTTTGTSGDSTTGTVTFSEDFTVPVGDTITISGVTPAAWNGTYIVTASSVGSVSFLTTVTSSMTVAGTIAVNEALLQPIYAWDAEHAPAIAPVIPQAPPVNEGVFVAMPQKQLIAYGSTFTGIQDPLLVRWCDVNNFSAWIGTVTNQAGSYRLPRGSRIVGGMQGPQQGILWTDIGVWAMQYIGQPGIYAFNEIATGCGLIAKKAAGALNNIVYWMGPSQFYSLSDDGVNIIPCDVWDVVFQNLDSDNAYKIRVAINSRFGEVAWYYPSLDGGGEVDSYVKLTVLTGQVTWDFGSLGRSAWIDQSVLGPPIGADPSSLYLYQHETSNDADGQAMSPSYRTGYFALAEGDNLTFVDQVWPDFKFGDYGGTMNATLNLTIYAAMYPGQTPTAFGPYTITAETTYFTTRIRARLLAYEISSDDVGSFWRNGDLRYRYQPDGRF